VRINLGLLLATMLFHSLSYAQLQQELSSELVRHTLVLRNFYAGQKLRFDKDGALISGGTPGQLPSEGRVYVEALQLKPGQLVIRGERPIPIFDPASGQTTLLGLHQKIEVAILLPSDKPTSDAARELLDKVFLTPGETNALACSTDEEKAFREWALQAGFVSAKPGSEKSSNGPRQLCFPGGSRGYLAGNGVIPPEALKTFDPAYPPGVARSHEDTSVVLALIVDSVGKPTSLVVVAGAATVFDLNAISAVRAWKFRPGSRQGRAVPTAIHVEVNFRSR